MYFILDRFDHVLCRDTVNAGRRIFAMRESAQLEFVDFHTREDAEEAALAWRRVMPSNRFVVVSDHNPGFIDGEHGMSFCKGSYAHEISLRDPQPGEKAYLLAYG